MPIANVFAIEGYCKEIIAEYQRAVDQASLTKRSEILLKLTNAYWQDQDQESAFRSFLSALDSAVCNKCSPMTSDEEAIYSKVLIIYLAHPGREAKETALQIRDQYTKILVDHPTYHHLAFLVALAEANSGAFPNFFARFYSSYCADPNHFLVYKTRALLHHRLMERARDPAQRDCERKQVFNNVRKAIERFSKDISLYQMLINFGDANEKD